MNLRIIKEIKIMYSNIQTIDTDVENTEPNSVGKRPYDLKISEPPPSLTRHFEVTPLKCSD